MSNADLGNKIRGRRKIMGLTQKQLAEKIGKVESTVRMWELGKNVPPADAIEKIAKILDINYFELMFLANHMNSTDVTKLTKERDDLEAKRTELRNRKHKIIEEINKIEFKLNKFLEMEKITSQESDEQYILEKEKKELQELVRSLVYESDDIAVEIDEINDLIRKSLEFKESEKAKNIIGSFVGDSKIDLENIFNSTQEVTFKGKILTDKEKQKVMQVLNITLED